MSNGAGEPQTEGAQRFRQICRTYAQAPAKSQREGSANRVQKVLPAEVAHRFGNSLLLQAASDKNLIEKYFQ